MTKSDTDVSWYEETPDLSIELISSATAARGAVIDVGGRGFAHARSAVGDGLRGHRLP